MYSKILKKYVPNRDDHGRFAVSDTLAKAESEEEMESHSPMVQQAIAFMKEKHAGQTRKASGLPYASHPLAVSSIVAAYKKSKHLDELVTAALLHDTIEDTPTTYKELETKFSPFVASLVHELTNDPEQMKEMGKLEYQKKKMQHMSSYGLVIKLADRLHNVSDNPTKKMLKDTTELVSHLENTRPLSVTQELLVKHIRDICNSDS